MFIIPFIPFIVSSSMFFPFITGKNFTFRVIVEIMLGSWIILAYMNATYRPRWSWIMAAFVAFISIVAIADIFGANPFKSIWSNFERMEGLVTHLHLFMYFVIASTILSTDNLWKAFFHTSLAASVMMAIYGFSQVLGDTQIHQSATRIDGRLGNATYFAVYALFHVGLSAFYYVREKNVTLRYMYAGIALLNLTIMYFTGTRGAMVGFVAGVGLTVLLVALFEKKHIKMRKIALGTLIGGALLFVLFFSFQDTLRATSYVQSSPTLKQFTSISLSEGSTRFMVWGMGLKGFYERPILGWGQENFNYVFNKYYNPKMYNQEQWFDRSHNVFFDWLIAAGILGLLAYLSLFGAAIYYIWFKLTKEFSLIERSVLIGLLGAYFVQNFFVFDNIVSYIIFFSILGYIHTMSVNNALQKKEAESGVGNKKRKKTDPISSLAPAHTVALASVVVVVLSVTIYYTNIYHVQAGQALIRALVQPISLNSDGEPYLTIEDAIQYDSFARMEIREQLVQMALRVSGNDNVPKEIQERAFVLAKSQMEEQIALDPENMRFTFFLGSMLNRFRLYEDAIKYLERSVELSPGKQIVWIELGNAYMNMGDIDNALNAYKTAYDLEPRYTDARDFYIASSIVLGKTSIAEEIISGITMENGNAYKPSQRIIQAYTSSGRHDKLVEIYEKLVIEARGWLEEDPEGANIKEITERHISLAAAYVGVDNIQKAVETIGGAIAINPAFEEQGNNFITQILTNSIEIQE